MEDLLHIYFRKGETYQESIVAMKSSNPAQESQCPKAVVNGYNNNPMFIGNIFTIIFTGRTGTLLRMHVERRL